MGRRQNPLKDSTRSLVLPERLSTGGSSSSDGEEGDSPAAPSAVAPLGEKGGKDSMGNLPKLTTVKKEGWEKKDGEKKDARFSLSISPVFSSFYPIFFGWAGPRITPGKKCIA